MNIQSLDISPELLKCISEIDEFRGGWNAVHSLTPERLEALRHIATIESIGSSTRIEGGKLTDVEIEELLGDLSQKSFKTRDEQEVAGYAEVMEVIFHNYENIPLNENYLKQLHSILLKYSQKDERHRGAFKTLSNNVEAFSPDGESLGVVFKTTTPFDTPREVEALLKWTRETLEDESIHRLITIGIFNVVFLAIHPFQDGNGRLSRVLVTLLLLKAGYSYIPYTSLESIIERNKESYYLALRRTQGTLEEDHPKWGAWLLFFMRSLVAQKKHLVVKMEQNQGWEGLPGDSVKVLEYLSKHSRITMPQIEEITGTPRATLKKRVNQLIKLGFISRYGKARGTWYSLKS